MKKLLIIVGLIISALSMQAQGVKISAMPTWTDPIDSLWFPVINYDGTNWVNYRAQGYLFSGGGGGSSTRFGYSGEDDAAGENRIFNLSTFYLQLVAGQSQFLFSDGSMNFEQSDGTSIGRVYGSYGVSGIYSENASNSFGLEFNAGANSASFLMDASTQLWMGTNSGTWDWEIRGLQTGTASQVLYYDPVTHDISTGAAPSGGGGGGIQSIEGNNGVTVLNDSIAQLGSATQGASTLTAIRYIDALTDRLEINGTGTYTFRATTTTNRAISGEASGAGIGVAGVGASGFAGIGVQGTADNGSGIGVQGNSSAGIGIQGASTSGKAGVFTVEPSSTNTSVEVLRILRSTSGTAANNIGGYISFWDEYSSPSTTDEAARIGATFTDISNRTSDLNFTTKNANSIVETMTLKGGGNLLLNTTGKAYALKSPDGTLWYITINNSGVLSTSTTAP